MAKPTITAYYLQGTSTTHNALTPTTASSPEYLGLSYIASTGTQCFDSGVYATEKTRVVIEFELTNVDARCLFGSYQSSGTARYLSYAGRLNSSKHGVFFHRANTASVTNGTVAAAANTRYVYDLNGPARTVTVNGTTSVTITNDPGGAKTRGSMVVLNARSNGNTPTSNGIRGRMYSCQIYDNGILVRDFVPVKRVSDNAIGVFDKITQQFCPNVGSGTFTAGDLNTSRDFYKTTITTTSINNLKTSNVTQWNKLRVLGWYDGTTNTLLNNQNSFTNGVNTFITYDNANHTYYCKIAENAITLNNQFTSMGTATMTVDTITPEYFGLEYLSANNADYINLKTPVAEINGFHTKFVSYDRLSSSDYGCIFGGRSGSLANELQLTSYCNSSSFIGSIIKANTRYTANFNQPGVLNEGTYQSNTYVGNGGAAVSINTTAYTLNNSMYVFGLNNNGSVTQTGIVDLYELQFKWDNSNIMDLIPVVRRTDLTPGLLDKVNGVFYENAITTSTLRYVHYNENNNLYKITLTATPLESKYYFSGWYNSSNQLLSKDKDFTFYIKTNEFNSLSTIYPKFSSINITINYNSEQGIVEGSGGSPVIYEGSYYIVSNPNDYINTHFKPTNNTRVHTKIGNFPRTSTDTWIFGERTSTTSKYYGFFATSDSVYRTAFYNATKDFATSVSYLNDMIIDKNKNVCTISNGNGEIVNSLTNTNGTFIADYELILLGKNMAGEITGSAEGVKMYWTKIYENDILEYDFVPVKKWNSTEVGLWNKVDNRFYKTNTNLMKIGPYNYENNVYATTLKARPKAGYRFDGWYNSNGNLLSKLTYYTVYPTENTTYEARFISGEAGSTSSSWRINGTDACIEFNGGYINTGIKLSNYPNLKIVLEGSINDFDSNNWMLGAADENQNYILMGYRAGTNQNQFCTQGGQVYSQTPKLWPTIEVNTNPHRFLLNFQTATTSMDYLDGETFSKSNTNTAPILIGAVCNKYTGSVSFGRCKINKVEMWNGSELIRDFHPLYVDGWGYGMVDRIENIFYPQLITNDASIIN